MVVAEVGSKLLCLDLCLPGLCLFCIKTEENFIMSEWIKRLIANVPATC